MSSQKITNSLYKGNLNPFFYYYNYGACQSSIPYSTLKRLEAKELVDTKMDTLNGRKVKKKKKVRVKFIVLFIQDILRLTQ
ncbi:MAG: hypothetical protein ACFFA3_16420 [Promethearchaeota archaeon]